MADENNEDDSWLYGSNANSENSDEQPQIEDKTTTDDSSAIAFPTETNQDDSRNDEYHEETNVRFNSIGKSNE